MEKVRIGIIGCGGIAHGKHMPALKRQNNVEMTAFCDIEVEKAVDAAQKYGVEGAKSFIDYRELLTSGLVDAVNVCTPNNSHAEIAIAAMEAGLHVLTEKPMAKTASDARAMVEASKRTGKILTVGYQSRYRADSQYLKRIISEGELGEIYMAKAHAVRRRAVPTWGVFLDAEKQGGGPLIDIGTHALDLTLWLMDNYEVASVTGSVYRKLADRENAANAWGSWDPKVYTVEDSAFGFIKMKNGATIFLESSWALNARETDEAKCTLYGSEAGADMKGGLFINGEKHSKLYVNEVQLGGKGVAFYDATPERPENTEMAVFVSAILNGTPLTILPEQACVVSEVLEAIYTSAETGRTITF
ncbi:MAG: Gfo/Idh/MocA family oxidoreductase [Capsulimonadales bacterium]|nr:Gfo/Idh/MocA family oxidoreductase [Capsulimonadales bacterium]